MTGAAALSAGLTKLGLDVDVHAQEILLAFLVLLEKWNRNFNLTAIRNREQMITHHLLDSLAVLPHLPMRAPLRLIDVGTGGGLPGIPLAIARPAWQVALLDANQKKGAFLRQASIELGLANAEVITARAESFRATERFDIAISRAYSDLATFAAAARPLLAGGGQMVAMKGAIPTEEMAALPKGIEVVGTPRLNVPGVDAERHLVLMEDRIR